MLDTTGQTLLSCTNTLHSSPDITGHLPRLENCELAMLLLALAWARKHEPGVVWWRLLSYNNILVSVSRMQEVIVYRFVMTGGCGVSGCHNTCHVMSRYVTMCHVANTNTAYIHTFATYHNTTSPRTCAWSLRLNICAGDGDVRVESQRLEQKQ